MAAAQGTTARDKLVEKTVKHYSWQIRPDMLNQPLLRLTSRKLLWLDCNQLTSKEDGGETGSRLRWTTLT